jgi:IS30 family transposase
MARRIQPVDATRYSAKQKELWMRRRPRTKYTEAQKAVMWERWKKGETLHQIARLFDRPHTSIRQILAESGGIRPLERRMSKLALNPR